MSGTPAAVAANLGSALKNGVLLLIIMLIMHVRLRSSALEAQAREGAGGGGRMDGDAYDAAEMMPPHDLPRTPRARAAAAEAEVPPTPGPAKPAAASDADALYRYVFGEEQPAPFKRPSGSGAGGGAGREPAPLAPAAKTAPPPGNHAPPSAPGDFLVISNYKGEKTMNGGELFDGLVGFDGTSARYSLL